MSTNRRLLAIATAVFVIAVGIAVLGSRGHRAADPVHPLPPPTSSHGAGIDHILSAFTALYTAPEAGTPCETAYNAFKASQDFAAQNAVTPVVLKLAPRDEFLQRCNALPPATQKCVVPKYLTDHRAECDGLKPPDDVLLAMVEMKRTVSGPPGQAEPPP
jgi:hypothetical protein